MNHKTSSGNEARQVVLSFIEALNQEDFPRAQRLVQEDLTFVGALGTRKGASAYFQDMERLKLTYEVIKTFAEQNDVCLWYRITMAGVTVVASGWYTVNQGKIASLQVVFDPRPVLEAGRQ